MVLIGIYKLWLVYKYSFIYKRIWRWMVWEGLGEVYIRNEE